jgi:transposase-like protein
LVILNHHQEDQLQRVADVGNALIALRRAARVATDETKAAVFAALDARVPISRVAAAAGIERSTLYRWLDERTAAA